MANQHLRAADNAYKSFGLHSPVLPDEVKALIRLTMNGSNLPDTGVCCSCARVFTGYRRDAALPELGMLCSPCTIKESRRPSSGDVEGITHAEVVHMQVVFARSIARHLKLFPHVPPARFGLLLELWRRQGGRCALSGRVMTVKSARPGRISDMGASLDRVDSNFGYVEGNLQWLCLNANVMKNNMTDQQLIEWCRDIVATADEASQARSDRRRKKLLQTGRRQSSFPLS